ncbi:MAG: hypothetical protein EBU82_13780 [Flavobacteriia bacterium]|nr:hypothetical protein [Flavobacteriia bacterium]
MNPLEAIKNAVGAVGKALTPKKKNNAPAKVNAPVIVVPNKKPNAPPAAPVAAPPPAPAPAPQKEASNTSNSTTLGNSEAQGPEPGSLGNIENQLGRGGRRRRHTRKHKRRARKSRRYHKRR